MFAARRRALTLVKLLFTFFLSYPLAGVLKRIPDNRPSLKNAFSIAVSLFYLVGVFDLWGGIGTIVVSSTFVYLLAAWVSGPLMPWIGFVFLMGHMSLSHIRRHFVDDPSLIDITGAQMVLVMKLSAFCWNVFDGSLPDADLSDFQRRHAVRELPSVLDFAGYVFFFPAVMIGPAFDYCEYRAWLDCTMFELPAGTDPQKAPKTRKKRKIPRSGTPAALKAATGLAWLVVFLTFGSWGESDQVTGPGFLSYGFLHRIFTLHMLGLTTRTKYYMAWCLSEGACILSGIGYNGVDTATGRADWSRLQNVKPLGIELAQNTRAYLGNWNINTNNWLRNYVYLRVTPKGKKPGFRASLATFTTSAFWHGFQSGYYLSFILAAFLQTVAKNARRFFRPFFLQPDGKTPIQGGIMSKSVYDVFSWTVTQLAFTFTVAPFILLSFESSMLVWGRVYFYCIIGTAISMAFFASPATVFLKKRLAARNARLTGGSGAGAQKATRPAAPSREGSIGHPVHGLPDDPGRDLDELMDEIRKEVESRRQRGMSVTEGLQQVVQQRMRESRLDFDSNSIKIEPGRIQIGSRAVDTTSHSD